MIVWIILLIILGLLLYVIELVLLPGITLAAIGSFICLVGAVAWAFSDMGSATGFIVLGGVVASLTILTILLLRPKTWNRLTLNTNIQSKVQSIEIEEQVELGVQGTTLTRLSPMGKVQIEGQIFEAKSLGGYIDQRREVVVIGYENFNIIVRALNPN